MVSSEEILNTIYKFYPKNISLDDVDAYDNSQEYLNRLKRCQEARVSNGNWIDFKNELNSFSKKEFDNIISDYSVLGTEPCYNASLRVGTTQQSVASVLISVIIPLWTYRFIDEDYSIRYVSKNESEEKYTMLVQSLIKKYFPLHKHITEEQHQVIVNDISTVFDDSPTIFEAIFKCDLN